MESKNLFCIFIFLYCIYKSIANPPERKDELKKEWHEILQDTSKWTTPENNRDFKNYNSSPCFDYGTFDFIIIGAGSTGAVIANRLSKNSKTTVLLIEAGGEEAKFSLVPLNVPHLIRTNMNWDYRTTPQNNICLMRPEGKCPYNRGKSLGGSSAINGMVISRANAADFDKWVKIGNTEWSFKKLLKYYKRSERVIGYGSNTYRGRTGPTYISRSSSRFSRMNLYNLLNKANEEAEVPSNSDYNGRSQIGFSLAQSNIKKGIRQSSNQAYLEPIRTRSNLVILTHAFVTKIEFHKNKANKIKFLHGGGCKIAKVKNEVVVSAGFINTPHLLQLSGIGPKDLLEQFNIDVVKDLPVGQNFQDHPCIDDGLEILTNITLHQKSFDEELHEYLHGKGRLASLFTSVISYYNFKNKSSEIPEIEYIYRLNYNTLAPKITKSSYTATFFMNIILQHSSSVGTIRIQSVDPLDYPVLDPHYLDNPKDIEVMIDAFEFLMKIIETPSFQKFGAKLGPFKNRECQKFKGTREFWACIIRYYGTGCNHGSSTCSMGSDTKTSVVNQELKVHGIDNLRVADASVFPFSLTGHVHANVLMVGEKAADLIINDARWKI